MNPDNPPGSPTLQALVAPHLPEVSAHTPLVLEAVLSLLDGRPALSAQDAVELSAIYMRVRELEAVASLLLQSFDTDGDGAVQWDELEEAHGLATRLLA